VADAPKKLNTWQSLAVVTKSWRFLSVTLLSFPSGLPLGVVLITIPYWMQQSGIDIKTIGLVSAAQIPYAFKFTWSPLIDRFAPRWGRKRFWILLSQVLLIGAFIWLTQVANSPSVAVVASLTLLVSFLSATQDITIDAYAVEVLRREEQGLAVGARAALARASIFMARLLNTFGPKVGWRWVFAALAALFVPFLGVTAKGPEPEVPVTPPRTLRAAVWEPFVGFFRHPRALEIAAFLMLYKFADNLATSLVSPFFGQMGYDSIDVGLAQGSIGMIFMIGGTIAGGLLTGTLGLGRALWIFGLFQALANLGYALVAHVGVFRPVMYGSVALEALASGMGTGAFSVFLLRLTQREFSATQYALFSSIFALGRTLAGPPAGFMVDALGWRDFFLVTPLFAIPGLAMLQRFAPWRGREVTGLPEEGVPAARPVAVGTPVTRVGLVLRGLAGAVGGCASAYSVSLLLASLKAMRGGKALDLEAVVRTMLQPSRAVDYFDLFGPPIFGIALGLATAAYVAARRGVASSAPAAKPG
jgi:PAT family beta-lactamase induction signal transducer AmpG